MTVWTIFGILILLMIVQLVGMRLQVKAYKDTVHRLHKLGNLGIGSMRGKFGPGHLVIIVCDNDGKILDGEIMQGMTIFSKFEKLKGIAGRTIYDLKKEYLELPKKARKQHKGHIQALEALELRLNPPVEEVEGACE